MEIEFKGFNVKGTPQEVKELVSKEATMAGAFTEALRQSEASVKRKYVKSGKYAKQNKHKLFVMTESHKEAIRKGVVRWHKKNRKPKMSKQGRDNIRRGILKSWKNRKKK